jgi:hypothetical protein
MDNPRLRKVRLQMDHTKSRQAAAEAFVCGDHNFCVRAAVLIDDLTESLGSNEGLVRENNQRGVYLRMQGVKSLSQRTRHSLTVSLVQNNI